MNYQICVRCVMDTSDPEITFDSAGLCSHCRAYDELVAESVRRAQKGLRIAELETLFDRVKLAGQGREYDCILGLSGGVDSSYVAYLAKRHGLRPLAVHFDSGWNSELAVNNIEGIVKKLQIDLHTHVVDWEEMSDLQLSFFKAGVANCDFPTDHAFPAILYREAARHGIKYLLSGTNHSTEFILPPAWGHTSSDKRHLKDIHKRFGRHPLKSYPTIGFIAQYIYFPYIRGIKTIRPLNFVPYHREEAKSVIASELGWRDYGGKHHESIFTRFFQGYYLPKKFGFEKRRAHLSTLINSEQMTRDQALQELRLPAYDEKLQKEDKIFVAKKLGLSADELDVIFSQPNHHFSEYASNARLLKGALKIKRALQGI